MAGRQSKWNRAKDPEQIVVQPRDKKIISAIYDYRYLSRYQIQTLFDFNCVTKVNIRLRKLYDHHYISRIFLPTTRGSSKAIYLLGSKGINIITEILGIDPLTVKKSQRESAQVKDLFLNHNLNLNEFRIAFTKAIQAHPDMKLERWINDHDCLQEYHFNYSGQKTKKTFRPDGYFRLWYKKKIYSFFIELDQSTMSQQRFKAKVKDYLEFARSGYYQKIFGVQYFRVLIIAPCIQRVMNLKKTVEDVTDNIFWFTTLNKVTSNGGFGPIWLRAGHDGLHPLIEIES